MKEIIKENKTIIAVIFILLILTIILAIYNSHNKTKLNSNITINSYISKLQSTNIKLNDYPCDIENVLKYNNIPYFNYNTGDFKKINDEILELFFLRTCYQNGVIDYEATLNDNILSVALNISHDTDDDLAYLEYKTYNIDTSNNTRINNKTLLNKYHLTINSVEDIIFDRFREYYNYEKSKNYINNESFNEYLNLLDYKPITLDNMNLFINSQNELILYKDYTLSEGMSIDENFPNLTIKFKLS